MNQQVEKYLARLPEATESQSPSDLYADFKFSPDANHLGAEYVYITGALNSGGARRKYSLEGLAKQEVDTLIIQICSENIAFANALLTSLCESSLFSPVHKIIHSYSIGVRKWKDSETNELRQWTETEYLLFWSMIIAGIDIQVVPEFQQEVLSRVSSSTNDLNSHATAREERVIQYQKLESAVLNTLSQIAANEYSPLSLILEFPDSLFSLGSTFERRLAWALGIPVSKVAFNLDHPDISRLPLWNDPVFELLRGVPDGLVTANDSDLSSPLSIIKSEGKPNYKVK